MFNKAKTAAVVALLVAALSPASAQQGTSGLPMYDVELIIFRHLSSSATPEYAQAPSGLGEPAPTSDEDEFELPIAANTAATAESGRTAEFTALPPSKLKLTAIEEALRRSRGYRPIAHIGWTQPGYGRDAARYLSIDALAPSVPGLEGQIALSRGRYLHLTLDLALTTGQSPGEPARRFVLKQSRRMTSNERHYIDHPEFGVIALVTRSGDDG